MFSAILGLAGTAVSAVMGSRAQRDQMNLAYAELDLKRDAQRDARDMSMRQWGMAVDQMRREREQEQYVRGIDEQNRRFLGEEYASRLEGQKDRKRQALQEREYVINRQVEMDQAQARRRSEQLEEYLRNQNLAVEERNYAKSLLEEARRTASDEARADLERYYREREQANIEREFAINELYGAQAIAQQERSDDMSLRRNIMSRTDSLQEALQSAYYSLGGLPDAPRMSREEIDGESARREALAVADTDRAIDRVASINEAGLMKRGVDSSSTAAARRGEVAQRAASAYSQAREAARDEAIKYLTGVQNTQIADWKNDMQRRLQGLSEVANVSGAGIDALLKMPKAASANDYRAPVQVGSGIFVRNTQSANNYRPPVALGSAMMTGAGGISTGMADTMVPPSVANAFALDAGSRTAPAASWNISSPASYAASAAQGTYGLVNSYNPEPYFARAASAGAGVGQALGLGLRNAGGLMDGWARDNNFSLFPQSNQHIGPGYTPATYIGGIPLPPERPGGYGSYGGGFGGSDIYDF